MHRVESQTGSKTSQSNADKQPEGQKKAHKQPLRRRRPRYKPAGVTTTLVFIRQQLGISMHFCSTAAKNPERCLIEYKLPLSSVQWPHTHIDHPHQELDSPGIRRVNTSLCTLEIERIHPLGPWKLHPSVVLMSKTFIRKYIALRYLINTNEPINYI